MANRRQSGDQIRRILLLAAGRYPAPAGTGQYELPLWFSPRKETTPPDLGMLGDRVHALLVELALLVQMEAVGLVASPLTQRRRQRFGLGSDPPMRLLAEWEHTRPLEVDPWRLGTPSAGREEAYTEGLGRSRALAGALDLDGTRVREIVRRLYPLAVRMNPEDDLAGQIHGHGLRHTLAVGWGGRLAFRVDRERSRGNGVIHTPPELAREVSATVLGHPLLVSPGRRSGGQEPGSTHASPEDPGLHLLDPACGSGQFLLACARLLLGTVAAESGLGTGATQAAAVAAQPGRLQECAARLAGLRQLWGVDLDPQTARIAAWNLSHWAAVEARGAMEVAQGSGPKLGTFLDSVLGSGFPYLLGSQIQVGNSLLAEASSFSPGFLWEKRFPRAFDRSNPGFDVVLGNPPWVSFGLRDRVAVSSEERAYYERLYPAGTQYKLTLYPLFMELAVRLCRRGGRHGFLVPDSVLSGHHFSRIRALLLAETDLCELTLVESGTWPGVHAGHTALYVVQKKGGAVAPPVSVRNRVLKAGSSPGAQMVWVPAVQYSGSVESGLRIYQDSNEMEFLSRMQRAPFRVRDVLWTYSGLIARYGQKSVQAVSPQERFSLRDARGVEVFVDPRARERWHPALWSGSEVVPYRIRWRGGHVYMPEPEGDLTRVYKSGFNLERYRGPKVFLRQTGDQLTAALDRSGLFCLNNLHLLGSQEALGVPPLLLVGLLMSEPMRRTYQIASREGSRPLAQVDLKAVEALPYPADPFGIPFGTGPAPQRSLPQSRRILRWLEGALDRREDGQVLAVLDEALSGGPAPHDGGPLSGREVVTLLFLRMLELREGTTGAEVSSAGGEPAVFLQSLLDQSFGRLFALDLPAEAQR